jgi:hypothetical protein
MKSLLFLSACGLVVTSMAACAPVTPPTARVALDCPMKQGDLKLSNVSPDKKTCLYSSRDGDQVLLRLIPVSGSYMTVLQPIEQELQGEVTTQPQTGKASAEAKPGSATTSISLAASDSAKAAKQAAIQDVLNLYFQYLGNQPMNKRMLGKVLEDLEAGALSKLFGDISTDESQINRENQQIVKRRTPRQRRRYGFRARK